MTHDDLAEESRGEPRLIIPEGVTLAPAGLGKPLVSRHLAGGVCE